MPTGKNRPRIRVTRVTFLRATLLMIWPGCAFAQLNLTPYLASSYQYNSNVFDLSPRAQADARAAGSYSGASDQVLRNIVGLNVDERWSRQHFFLKAESRRFNYVRFSRLDHNEYLLNGGLDLTLTSVLNGTLNVSQERRMAAFADRNTTQLTLERERIAEGTFNFLLSPEWAVVGGARSRDLYSPLPNIPKFGLTETSGQAGIKYLGIRRFTAGIEGEYLAGSFSGTPDRETFRQQTVQFTTTYEVSGLSTFNTQLGYTRRRDDFGAGGTTSAFTGDLGYRRVFTGKTSADLHVFRRVNSYVAGANSVIDTGASVGAEWKPTAKITVNFAYTWTQSKFQGQPAPGVFNPGRSDRFQDVLLKAEYQALYWLSVRPMVEYQDRHSNVELARYKAFVTLIELRLSFPDL